LYHKLDFYQTDFLKPSKTPKRIKLLCDIRDNMNFFDARERPVNAHLCAIKLFEVFFSLLLTLKQIENLKKLIDTIFKILLSCSRFLYDFNNLS